MALVPPTSVGSGTSSSALAQVYDNVAAGAIASWDVTGIAATYTHLQLVISARGDTAATLTGCELQFNGDTAANYDLQQIRGNAATASAAENLGSTKAEIGNVAAASATATLVGVIVAWIPDYASTTFRKQVISDSSEQHGVATTNLNRYALMNDWRSTAAINRVTIFPNAGNFIAGSRLTIYGLT